MWFKKWAFKSFLSQEVFKTELDTLLVEMLQIGIQDSMGIKVEDLFQFSDSRNGSLPTNTMGYLVQNYLWELP